MNEWKNHERVKETLTWPLVLDGTHSVSVCVFFWTVMTGEGRESEGGGSGLCKSGGIRASRKGEGFGFWELGDEVLVWW